MKFNRKSPFVMAATFILLSLVWFFWIKNTTTAIIWLAAGLFELILGLIARAKGRSTR